MRPSLGVLIGFLAVGQVVLAGCGDPASPPVPASLSTIGPGVEVGVVGTSLPSVAIKVVDGRGRPLSGVAVTWVVLSGGGSVSPQLAETGTDGTSRTTWTLGPAVGQQVLAGNVAGMPPAIFTVIATADQPASIAFTLIPFGSAPALSPGSTQYTTDALGDSADIRARVTDRHGNEIPNVQVTWSSSDSSVALVRPTGRLLIRENGHATLTVSMGVAQGILGVSVSQVATNILVSPSVDTLAVNATGRFSASVTDRNGHLFTAAAVSWSTGSPSVASVSVTGAARGRGAGTTAVNASSGGASGQAVLVVEAPVPPTWPTQHVSGTVAIPASLDSSMVYVVSGAGGPAEVGDGGAFQIQMSSDVEGAVLAMSGDQPFGLALVPPPAGSGSAARGIRIDPWSTAVALVYLTPPFAVAPASLAEEVLHFISSVPEVQGLAQLIDDRLAWVGVLPDSSDAGFLAAYEAAVRAAHHQMALKGGPQDREQDSPTLIDQAEFYRSGVRIEIASESYGTTAHAQVTNRYGRDVDLYVMEADTAGRPLMELSSLDEPTAGGLWLRPADYVPNLASFEGWLRLLRGEYGAAPAQSLDLRFSPERSRFAIYAYGLGFRNVGEDLGAIRGTEKWRLLAPCGTTVFFSVVLPVIEAATGLHLTPENMSVSTREQIMGLLATGKVLDCIWRGDDATMARVLGCIADQLWSEPLRDKRLLAELIRQLTSLLGLDLSLAKAMEIATSANLIFKTLAVGNAVGDLAVTGYAILNSEVRQEFDLSYSDLIGAESIDIVSGNDQSSQTGQPLPHELVVRVTRSSGAPVAGAWVIWMPQEGNGSVTRNFSTTDAVGLASVRWTLGSDTDVQQLTASIAGTPRTVVFTTQALTSVPVSSVSVAPSSASITVGGSVQLTATPRDSVGNAILGKMVTWASSDTSVAPVSSAGLVSGVAEGSATITATIGGTSGTALVTVTTGSQLGVGSTLSAGPDYTCGVAADGAAYCWGWNSSGELGDGSTSTSLMPVPVSGGLTFASISANAGPSHAFSHTCGVTIEGAAYCWGYGGSGRLGNGSSSASQVPVPVSGGLTFALISTGENHTCAVTTSGEAYCWGSNLYGKLGNGTTSNSSTPVLVAGGHTFASVSAGYYHTCGVTTGGAAYCWGNGGGGRLGNGSTANNSIPTPVSGGQQFTSTSAGSNHSCGVTVERAAYCWGDAGIYGRLGNDPPSSSLTPVPVSGGHQFVSISADIWHTCGVDTDGAAWCWGSGAAGKLGDGTGSTSKIPVGVLGGLVFTSVSTGDSHTCGLTTGGTGYCWGSGASGRLGHGTTESKSTPFPVSGALVFKMP